MALITLDVNDPFTRYVRMEAMIQIWIRKESLSQIFLHENLC